MSIESLMRAVSVKSNSFYDSYGQGGGNNSELRFSDMVRASIGMLDSQFDQELVLMVYCDEGDKDFVNKQLLNMIYSEIPDMSGVVSKIDRLKRCGNYPALFKGFRALDDMLHSCAYLAVESAVMRKRISSRDCASRVGCSKDTYINNFRDAVDSMAQNLSDRLVNAERKIKAVIYE